MNSKFTIKLPDWDLDEGSKTITEEDEIELESLS